MPLFYSIHSSLKQYSINFVCVEKCALVQFNKFINIIECVQHCPAHHVTLIITSKLWRHDLNNVMLHHGVNEPGWGVSDVYLCNINTMNGIPPVNTLDRGVINREQVYYQQLFLPLALIIARIYTCSLQNICVEIVYKPTKC